MYSSELPIKLEDGEEAKGLIPLDKDDNWIESFKNNLSWFARWDLYFTNIEVFTSHGFKYKSKIGANIRDELIKELKNKKTK